MPNYSGLGCKNFDMAVYIANTPPMNEYQNLIDIRTLAAGEIQSIGQTCGNGWRKVFNVYAKLLFALDRSLFKYSELSGTWQEYRDQWLLQKKSKTALIFSMPEMDTINPTNLNDKIHILCGRTYAKDIINRLTDDDPNFYVTWLDEEFAVNYQYNIVVCPYFDYRQLSNIKIGRLSKIIKAIKEQRDQ